MRETDYKEPKQGPKITITREALLIDSTNATIPTAEFAWEYLDSVRARLNDRNNSKK